MKNIFLVSIIIFVASISVFGQWDKIYKESEGLRVVVKDGKYGYINKQDEVVIPLQYDKVGHFKMGLATAKENGTWKYIDQKNNVVYDKYKNEVEGMRAVYKGSKCGFINKDRKLIVPLIYDKVFDFKNGYAVVEKNKKRGYVQKDGKLLTEIKFDKAFNFSKNMATVQQGNKQGCINTKGKLIIPCEYDKIYAFDDSYQAKVKKDGKTGKISLSGNVTWNIQIGDIVNNGIVFYVDKSGRHGLICSKKNMGGDSRNYNLNKAEEVCDAYEGYNSWRLPTLEEAKIMFQNKDEINTIIAKNYSNAGFLFINSIWTSTKSHNAMYYIVNKNSPNGSATNIITELNARAVKEF